MIIDFIKMHALGNDFVVINNTKPIIGLTKARIKVLADRYCGIGFDQLILIETADYSKSEFVYRIFNADGSEIFQCGNGARCVAKYLVENALCAQNILYLKTKTGTYEVLVKPDLIRVNMRQPIFEINKVPYKSLNKAPCLEEEIKVKNITLQFGVCSVGNPHAVIIVNDIDNCDVATIGAILNEDPRFPEGVNVEFMKIISPSKIQLRVYERGVGETWACGSGACAAVVIGRLKKILDETVEVNLAKGNLEINWRGIGSEVFMHGGATLVYRGQLDPEFIHNIIIPAQ